MSQQKALLRLLVAFAAGFLSVLLFHQGMLALLHAKGLTPLAPYPTQPTQPFGILRIWSLAFWGGVWGMGFAVFAPRFRQSTRSWGTALLFGALGPTLVNWFVVMPLKGQPLGGGWQPAGIATGLILNGVWGVGTALLFRVFAHSRLGRNKPKLT